MIPERDAFCQRLRDARLQRGLTLEAIGESSKINVALLAGLERGDVSRWPKGIFRRAFLREYAATIGVPPEPTVVEFGRLFPEDIPDADPDLRVAQPAADGLRLTLAADRRWWLQPTAGRFVAAILDLLIVVLAGAAAARLLSGSFWVMTSAVALVYYCAATAFTGATPGSIWLSRRAPKRPFRWARQAMDPVTTDRPRLVFSRSDLTLLSEPPQPDEHSAVHEKLRAASH